MGAQFGSSLNNDASLADALKNVRKSFEQMMENCGAVNPTSDLEDETHTHANNAGSASTMGMALGNSGTFNFSRSPKKGLAHDCVCDENNNPR